MAWRTDSGLTEISGLTARGSQVREPISVHPLAFGKPPQGIAMAPPAFYVFWTGCQQLRHCIEVMEQTSAHGSFADRALCESGARFLFHCINTRPVPYKGLKRLSGFECGSDSRSLSEDRTTELSKLLDGVREAFSLIEGHRYNVDEGHDSIEGSGQPWGTFHDALKLSDGHGSALVLCASRGHELGDQRRTESADKRLASIHSLHPFLPPDQYRRRRVSVWNKGDDEKRYGRWRKGRGNGACSAAIRRWRQGAEYQEGAHRAMRD
jgi:hypothetical protein